MATAERTAGETWSPAPVIPLRELCAGDRLTRAEFERRYSAMPAVKKAELIEGVVYMPSPVSHQNHGRPHSMLIAWLGHYWAATPGVDVGDNATVRLDLENEPQPDALLRILPNCGGQSRDEDSYIAAAPELIAEVAASSASYDLHDKLRAISATASASILSGGCGIPPSIGSPLAKGVLNCCRSTRRGDTRAACSPASGSIRPRFCGATLPERLPCCKKESPRPSMRLSLPSCRRLREMRTRDARREWLKHSSGH